jgi:hypothetical protein
MIVRKPTAAGAEPSGHQQNQPSRVLKKDFSLAHGYSAWMRRRRTADLHHLGILPGI